MIAEKRKVFFCFLSAKTVVWLGLVSNNEMLAML